jgi:hypothetical protein
VRGSVPRHCRASVTEPDPRTRILDEGGVVGVSEQAHDELAVDAVKDTSVTGDDGRKVLRPRRAGGVGYSHRHQPVEGSKTEVPSPRRDTRPQGCAAREAKRKQALLRLKKETARLRSGCSRLNTETARRCLLPMYDSDGPPASATRGGAVHTHSSDPPCRLGGERCRPGIRDEALHHLARRAPDPIWAPRLGVHTRLPCRMAPPAP